MSRAELVPLRIGQYNPRHLTRRCVVLAHPDPCRPEIEQTPHLDVTVEFLLSSAVHDGAADLYVLLWNRTPDASVTMTGNADLMELWRGNFRVRWG